MKSIFVIVLVLVSPFAALAAPIANRVIGPITSAGISAQIAAITNQSVVTIPADALAAFETLAKGGSLSASEKAAITTCADAARVGVFLLSCHRI